MTLTLAFEKKHARKVLPTRALGDALVRASASAPDAQEALHTACRRVVAECGPSPYLYAGKHCPAAMAVMGGIERALWPESENVPAAVPAFAGPELDAALYRTFRLELDAERFVAAWWVGGPERALEVLARLDEAAVALTWCTKPARIDAWLRTSASDPLLSGSAGALDFGVMRLARALRGRLVSAAPAVYDRATLRAHALSSDPSAPLWLRAALAFALPDEPELVDRALTELLAFAPPDGRAARAPRQWLRWMLTAPLALPLAVRVLDAIEDDVACEDRRDDSPLFTWIALAERAGDLEALAALLIERTRRHLTGRSWARARGLGDGLVALRGESVTALLVEHVAHKAFEKSGPDYLTRHADLALPALAAAGADSAESKSKSKKSIQQKQRAAELEQVLRQAHPELAHLEREGPAPRAPSAPAAALPGVLAVPPWAKRAAPPPPTCADAPTLPHEEALDFEHGEREAWLAQASAWLRGDVELERIYPPGTTAGVIAYNLALEASRQQLLAARGLAAIDWLILHAEHRGNGPGLEPMSRIDSPRIAPQLARVLAEGTPWARVDAQVALVRHPRAAAVGLVPRAAQGDVHAREALQLLVLAGEGAALREVIAASGAGAGVALADLVALTPAGVFPARRAPLPKFFVAEGLPAPVLAASGEALDPAAVATLGALLRLTETLFPHPGVADVRAICTQVSLDRFAWALEKAWEHAKAPDAQRFAAVAVGHLGGAAALRALADEVATLDRKKKPKVAVMLLEAFAASPLPDGAMLLGRFATEAREPAVRLAAERWLAALQRLRRTVRAELTFAFPTLGFERGDVPIEGEVCARLDDSGSVSLRPTRASARGKVAPKDLSAAGAAAWTELKELVADTRGAILRRLELALSERERFTREALAKLLGNPLVSRLACRLVFGAFAPDDTLLQALRPTLEGGFVDLRGAEATLLDGAGSYGLAHPLDLDALGPEVRAAFRAGLVAPGGERIEQPIEQLDRATSAPGTEWPNVRGVVVPYRRVEALLDRRGWRLYRTGCGAPLHDWSYLQKSVDQGRVRLSIGFNFGRNVGDSVLGEVLGQAEDGVPGVRAAARVAPAGVSAVAMSELHRDLASLR